MQGLHVEASGSATGIVTTP